MSTAFIAATPVLARATPALNTTSFATRRTVAAVPARRPAIITMKDGQEFEKIPQGFTAFSEQLNGRAAMMGFLLAVVTEAITGKGIIGQVGSIFDILNLASALSN